MGSAALVLALGLLLSRRRWRVWGPGALFVFGVGFSRVYLGVHYPSDVLSGWLATVGWVMGVYVLLPPNQGPKYRPVRPLPGERRRRIRGTVFLPKGPL